MDLHDAVAVYRNHSGELRINQTYQMTAAEGAGCGGLWGTLIGALLAIPFSGGASAAVAAGAVAAGAVGGGMLGATGGAIGAGEWKEDYGISESFVYDVSGMVQPGDSGAP